MTTRTIQFILIGEMFAVIIGAAIWSLCIRPQNSERTAAIEWAKQVPAHTLIDTHQFNGREWKTYRHNATGKLFLLSPMGAWIDVED